MAKKTQSARSPYDPDVQRSRSFSITSASAKPQKRDRRREDGLDFGANAVRSIRKSLKDKEISVAAVGLNSRSARKTRVYGTA